MEPGQIAEAYNDAILAALTLLEREHRVQPAVRVRMCHALQQSLDTLLIGPASTEAARLLSLLGSHAREALAQADQADNQRFQNEMAAVRKDSQRQLEEQRLEAEESLARVRATIG